VLPEFSDWVREEVRQERQSGINVPGDVLDTSRGPLEMATAFKSMYSFGNHFRVRSAEQSMRTCDSGVAATFKQVCRNRIRDVNLVHADVEYVGHIEEILEVNYKRHCVVVLVCDFVKANYRGENATIKKDNWGFTLANYNRRPGIICKDSFAFPKQCEQVFYYDAKEAPGWKVVMKKEVRGRRVLPNNEEEIEAELFDMGADEDFEGLRPHREVGEGPEPPVGTGYDVVRKEVLVTGRATSLRERGGRGSRWGARGGGSERVPAMGRGAIGRPVRGGRGRGRWRPNAAVDEENADVGSEEDRDAEELLYAGRALHPPQTVGEEGECQQILAGEEGHVRGRDHCRPPVRT
jgi:hypothetical protein